MYTNQLRALRDIFAWQDRDLIAVLDDVGGDLDHAITRITQGAETWHDTGRKTRAEKTPSDKKHKIQTDKRRSRAVDQAKAATHTPSTSNSERKSTTGKAPRDRTDKIQTDKSQTEKNQTEKAQPSSSSAPATGTWAALVRKVPAVPEETQELEIQETVIHVTRQSRSPSPARPIATATPPTVVLKARQASPIREKSQPPAQVQAKGAGLVFHISPHAEKQPELSPTKQSAPPGLQGPTRQPAKILTQQSPVVMPANLPVAGASLTFGSFSAEKAIPASVVASANPSASPLIQKAGPAPGLFFPGAEQHAAAMPYFQSQHNQHFAINQLTGQPEYADQARQMGYYPDPSMYKSFGESGVASAAGQHAPNYPMYGYYPQYYVPNHYQSGYQAQPVFPATKSFQPGSAQTVPPGAAALPNAGSPTAKKDVPAAANSHQYASMGQFTGMSQSPAYYHQPPPQQQPYSNSLGIQQGYGKGGYASPSYPQQGTSAPERSSFKDQRENASANANRTRYQGTYVAPNGTGQAAGGHNGYYNQQFAGQYQQQQYSAHYHNYGSAQQQAPHQSQTQQQQQQPRQGGYWGAQQQS